MFVEDRFWSKVNKTDTCWLWLSSLTQGYGSFWMNGKPQRAHRIAYELRKGPIPESMELDHLCRNRACVNPAHLQPVDHRTNVLRGASLMAMRAKQTYCKQGHAFDVLNTYYSLMGTRRCRRCRAECEKKRRQKERENYAPYRDKVLAQLR